MKWELVAVILAGYAASLFFVPHQIMLATSNRIGFRSERFRGKFRFAAPLRMAVAIAGAAVTVILSHVAAPLWMAGFFGLMIFLLYLLDFYQVERISRKLTDPR